MSNAIYVVDLDRKIDVLESLSSREWNFLYTRDRQHGDDGVRVEDRGIRCAGICWKQGVVAWMYLRESGGQRQAVHQRAEDQDRHNGPARSPEHIAWQERGARAAHEGGFPAETQVRATGPRGRIETDVLIHGDGGRKIGIEVQLSGTPRHGKSSVPYRVKKAKSLGITPWWHTDRDDYARRRDAHWTYSNRLPAHVIEKTGDLRIVSGFRVLDFWRCDTTAIYPCPAKAGRRCGDVHVTPKPRSVLFDDLVRKTAAGLIVPLGFQVGSGTHRFWVPEEDRERYLDNLGGPPPEPEDRSSSTATSASRNAPTCRPRERIEVISRPLLDWRDRSHAAPRPGPCRICGKTAHLLDDQGRHAHKVCVEETAA